MPQEAVIGSVYSKTGAAFTTSYTFGSTFFASRAISLNLYPETTADAGGSSIVSMTVKLQGRRSSTSPWLDIMTIDINSASQAVEHLYNSLPAAGLTSGYGPLNFDPRDYAGGFQVGVKGGHAGAGTDNVSVYAVAAV